MPSSQASSDSPTLDLLVFATPGVDVTGLLGEAYNTVHEDEYGERLDDREISAMVTLAWSAQISTSPPRVAWRVSLTYTSQEIQEGSWSFAQAVNSAVVDLARSSELGILAIVKLADPLQLHGHTALYREVYSIEMALREVVSYIFAAEFPDNLVDALTMTTVKPASSENLPQDSQLIKYGENRFFYILFDRYAVLNRAPEVTAANIAIALRGGTNLDEVREKLDLRPIKEERHAGFLASLLTLMDPLERVRNAVAHNRTIPQTVLENYHEAAKTLRRSIDAFWTREAEHLGDQPPGGV